VFGPRLAFGGFIATGQMAKLDTYLYSIGSSLSRKEEVGRKDVGNLMSISK
jgi:hypothetical protein